MFENNICPYKEPFGHGFEMITYNEYGLLGLDFIIWLDQNFSIQKDCCRIEQAC
jgi:hypothetical protein